MKKDPLIASLILACAALSPAGAATTILIDYDDGIADNGMHDASIRNGGFDDAADPAGTSFASIPFWNSYFAEGDSTTGVLATGASAHLGGQRIAVSGFNGAGTRLHAAQTIPSVGWTIQAGDVFTFSLYARGGAGFDLTVPLDGVNLVLHVVNSLGVAVNDPVNGIATPDRIASSVFTGVNGSAGAFTLLSVTTNPIAADSPWIGNQIQPRILVSGDRSEFAQIDSVFLTATSVPEPGIALLGGLGLLGLLRRRR